MRYQPEDKFVLEIRDTVGRLGDGDIYYEARNYSPVISENELNQLERLDSDYINEHFGHLQDEAYEEGKKAGIEIGELAGYKTGMKEAWELARKIALFEKDGGMTVADLREVFGDQLIQAIFRDNTPQEIKSKIEAWEKSKAEIKVGDVVTHDKMGVHIITNIDENGFYTLMSSDGRCACSKRQYLTKTGRTIDIASVLEQIGGTA